jgi:hypothetical protein
VLIMMMLAEAAAVPPPPAQGEKCVILIEYVQVVPAVTGFGWSTSAQDQSQTVSHIVTRDREPAASQEGKLPEADEPKAEPAVQSPQCAAPEPAGKPKRRKNERLS